ncbi:hypothetical protein [Patulibacter minatonensis]|uniref:hypothetical protein n=1 Tax=Patulibacter minatonensis TaxID=298163 RepID=UPI000478A6CD|nr:hypothetical protein [Patulibacter minatonensis]
MKPAPQLVRPSLPRWVLAVGVLAYAPLIIVLVILVLQLQDTRTTVDGRLATAVGRLERATLPLAGAVTPAARAATADRPAAQRLTTRGISLLRSTEAIARDTNAHAANLDRKLGGDLPVP